MIRPPIILRGPLQRQLAASFIMDAAPDGCVVEVRPPRRSDEQSRLMHSMAGDLSKQVPWCGQTLSKEQWKRFATAKLKKDKIVFDCNDRGEPDPNAGLIVLGASTKDMSTKAMGEIITWFEWFGAQHGVEWSHEKAKIEQLEAYRR